MRSNQTAPIRAASFLDGSEHKKLQTWVEAYTHWVVMSLVGIKGRRESDVVATLLREWIKDNRDDLEKLGLWPPQLRSGKAVIVRPGA